MPSRQGRMSTARMVIGAVVVVAVVAVGYGAVRFLTADHGRFDSMPSVCALIPDPAVPVFLDAMHRTPESSGNQSECRVSEQDDYEAGAGFSLTVQRFSAPFGDAPATAAELMRSLRIDSAVTVEDLGDEAYLVPSLNHLSIRVSNLVLYLRPNSGLRERGDEQLAKQIEELGRAVVGRLPE